MDFQDCNALLTQAEVMSLLSYKSVSGFQYFVKRREDFPRPVRRSKALNSRVFYRRSEIVDWLYKNM